MKKNIDKEQAELAVNNIMSTIIDGIKHLIVDHKKYKTHGPWEIISMATRMTYFQYENALLNRKEIVKKSRKTK